MQFPISWFNADYRIHGFCTWSNGQYCPFVSRRKAETEGRGLILERILAPVVLSFLFCVFSFFTGKNEGGEVSGLATLQEEEILIYNYKLYRERNSILERQKRGRGRRDWAFRERGKLRLLRNFIIEWKGLCGGREGAWHRGRALAAGPAWEGMSWGGPWARAISPRSSSLGT